MKKIFAIILSLVLLFGLSTIAFAYTADETDGDRTSLISSVNATISHGAINTKVKVKCTCTSTVTQIKIKMELQKLTSGSYSTVQTWESTFNSRTAEYEESKVTSPLATYRLKATVTAKSGTNTETKTYYVYES